MICPFRLMAFAIDGGHDECLQANCQLWDTEFQGAIGLDVAQSVARIAGSGGRTGSKWGKTMDNCIKAKLVEALAGLPIRSACIQLMDGGMVTINWDGGDPDAREKMY